MTTYYIASRQIDFPFFSQFDHAFLVKDPNDVVDNNETIIRGGPLFGLGLPEIRLELGENILESDDEFDDGLGPMDWNYTPISLTDQQWNDIISYYQSFSTNIEVEEGEDRWDTDLNYLPTHNSNSIITTALSVVGINIFDNLPQLGGAGPEIDVLTHPGLGTILIDGAGTHEFLIADDRIREAYDYGTGHTTLKIDGSALAGSAHAESHMTLTADTNLSSADTIRLENVTLSDVSYGRAAFGNLTLYLPDDEFPSMVLAGQFDDTPFNTLKIADDEITYNFSLTDPNSFSFAFVPQNLTSQVVAELDNDNSYTFAANSYSDLDYNSGTNTLSADLLGLGGVVFGTLEIDVTANTGSFEFANSDGFTITLDDVPEDVTLAATGTPKEIILGYLSDLGESMTEAEFDEAYADYTFPEGTPFNASASRAQDIGSVTYTFSTIDPNATVTGYTTQENIVIGYDINENPIYGDVTPTNILQAAGDISHHTITDVETLSVFHQVALTEDQFYQFDQFRSMDAGEDDFTFYTVGGGTFDTNLINVEAGSNLSQLVAGSWEGTTLIGSQSGQILVASQLGDDTLIADAAGITLTAGNGVNTLEGSSGGSTTFNVGFDGLAAGSSIIASGSNNTINARGDLSNTDISGVQTLNAYFAANDSALKLTEDQFNAFTTMTGAGELLAATDGTYDWSGQAVEFTSAWALSADGTTLIGNASTETLYGSAEGDDTLTLASGNSRTIDARNSVGTITMTTGNGTNNTIYAGYGVSDITMGSGSGNRIVANYGLASGSSIDTDNDSDSELVATGDISGAMIDDIYELSGDTEVTLTATQLAEFDVISTDVVSDQFTLVASTAGTYSLAGKTITGAVALSGTSGNDTLMGSSGTDILSYANATAGVTVDLGNTSAQNTVGAGTDTVSAFENLLGSNFDDTLTGNSGNNVIKGGYGNDTIRGYTGEDDVYGGYGDDTIILYSGESPSGEIIDGGAGYDKLVIASNNAPGAAISNMEELYFNTGATGTTLTAAQLADFDVITHQDGGSATFSITAAAAGTYSLAGKTITGILTLNGSSGVDTITGSSGNDIIRGFEGADTIYGGDGDDTILLNSGEVPSGETIDGGAGTDRVVLRSNNTTPGASFTGVEELYFNSAVTGVTLTTTQLNAFGTITHANGGAQAFSITANGAGSYSLAGKTITGLATLAGSSSADSLTGSSGNDTVNGNNGDDVIDGGLGNDTLNGGGSTDTLVYGSATSGVTVDLSVATAQNTGGAGTDTISNFENLAGSAYNDTLYGTSGNNTLSGNGGADTLYAGQGDDTYVVDNTSDVVSENASEGTDTVMSDVTWTLGSNVEHLTFSGSANVDGTGNTADNTIIGNSGVNTLYGMDGHDTLIGGIGADTIYGGEGDDIIRINSGECPSGETIDGGNGTDRLVVGNNNMTPGATLSNMEELYLNTGVTNVNLTSAQLGDFDTITHQSGSGQAFTITAAANGTYTLAGKTITGIATLAGSSGADTLTGSSANDTVTGNAGNDMLDGGSAGNDTLTGGANDDTYVFGAGYGIDTITDMNGSGDDTISMVSSGYADYTALQAIMTESGSDVLITLNGSDTLVIANKTLAQLNSSDFAFI